jgi:hypothetical protein
MTMRSLNHYFKKGILVLLLVAIVTTSSIFLDPPKKVHAAIPGTKCVAEYISALAASFLEFGTSKIYSIPINNSGGSFSEKTQAAATQSEYIIDCLEHSLALGIARELLAQMTNSIVRWINSGFDGSPSFITNTGDFFKGIADQVVSDILTQSDLAFLCTPFKLNVKLAIAFNYRQNTDYTGKAACTLETVVKNMDNFYKDFNEGGWAGWISMTQNSNNNVYGSFLSASAELESRTSNKKIEQGKQLDWGNGFLSYEECTNPAGEKVVKWGGKYGNESQGFTVKDERTSTAITQEAEAKRLKCEVKTPGKTIAGVLDKQLGVPADQLGIADDLDKIINALGDQLFQQIFKGAGGLLGSTQSQSNTNKNSRLDDWIAVNKQKADKNYQDYQNNWKNSDDSLNGNGPTIDTGGNITDGPTNPGGNPPTSPAGTNISLGKTVQMSTTGSNPNTGSFDGSKLTDGNKSSGYVTQDGIVYTGAGTRDEATPSFMTVDLGNIYKIGKITAYQRVNPGPNLKPIKYHLEILDTANTVVWTSPQLTQDYGKVSGGSGGVDVQEIIPSVSGRYVRIQGEEKGPLVFAELEVLSGN